MVPNFPEVRKSQILKPDVTWTWSYKSPERVMNAGVYTQDTVKAFQNHIMLPQEIEIAQKNTARQSSMGYGITDQGIRFRNLIDEQTISNMVENKLHKMWGRFTSVGTFVSGTLGIIFIGKLCITLVNYFSTHIIRNFRMERKNKKPEFSLIVS